MTKRLVCEKEFGVESGDEWMYWMKQKDRKEDGKSYQLPIDIPWSEKPKGADG